MKIFRRAELPEEVETMDAGLEVLIGMIADNARQSLRDGRRSDYVADLAQASRLVQTALYEGVQWAQTGGGSLDEQAAHARVSTEYLQRAYERFDPGRAAHAGPGSDQEEPWRVLG